MTNGMSIGIHDESGQCIDQEMERQRPLPLEIETKIIEGVDIPKLVQKVLEMGGMLQRENALIRDRNFSLDTKKQKVIDQGQFFRVQLPSSKKEENEKFRTALRYLGLPIRQFDTDQEGGYYLVGRPDSIPQRSVRFREINGIAMFFSVKQKRRADPVGGIDSRVEIEIPTSSFTSIENLLKEIGYQEEVEFRNEKIRTTYQLGTCLIEINSSSHLKIPPWIEIEGPSPQAIRLVAARLAIPESSFVSMSLKEQIRHFEGQ